MEIKISVNEDTWMDIPVRTVSSVGVCRCVINPDENTAAATLAMNKWAQNHVDFTQHVPAKPIPVLSF